MLDLTIGNAELLALIDILAGERRLVGPVARGGRHFYDVVTRADQIDLTFDYCVYGPRSYLFPPTETLFEFDRLKGGFVARPVITAPPTALVGVHPCDLHAIRLLDHVFSRDPPDEHYQARRANTFIIGADCPGPCTTGVFCMDMGTHEATEGFDVMLYPLYPLANTAGTAEMCRGDGELRFGVRLGTEAGRKWVLGGRYGRTPTADDKRVFEQYRLRKGTAFVRTLNSRAEDLPALLDRSYDSLLWEAVARRCYSCGSCNLVCPTCYCFDILDRTDVTLSRGQRLREWDGCQLPAFAEVAGGHSFRPRAASRLRHRIFRKAKWIRQRTGLPGCVGCARCDRACTAKISSVDIYNQLAEEGCP